MKAQKMSAGRGSSPFDDSAAGRLKHMGLLDDTGGVARTNTAALSQIMAGLFFNDLCDYYNESLAVAGIYEDLRDYHAMGDYRRLLVRYSLQYDIMYQPLPAVVWWLSGTKELTQTFLDCLMKVLGLLVKGLEDESGVEGEPG